MEIFTPQESTHSFQIRYFEIHTYVFEMEVVN
jgi:hypothetical protein